MGGPRRIDAKVSREFRAVIFAMKAMPTELRREVRQQVKALGQPEWVQSMREHATTRLDHRMLADTARLTPSDQNVKLTSATVGRPLAGGLSPKDNYYASEFGADRNKTKTYTQRSRKGNSFTVHDRHTTHQIPARRANGRVFFPAAAQMIPRIAALFAQTVVRTVGEALEGKRG